MVIPGCDGDNFFDVAWFLVQLENRDRCELMLFSIGKAKGAFIGLKSCFKLRILTKQCKTLTRNEPHTRSSPSVLIAADILSPAAILTARNFSSRSVCRGCGTAVSSSISRKEPGLFGSGTSLVIRPRAASSLTPQDHTYKRQLASEKKSR